MSTTEQSPELEAAEERANAATKAFQEATTAVNNAWAEHARLTLLKLSEEHPELQGLSFETSYEYDDEGGYYASVSVYPLIDGDILEIGWNDYELEDEFSGYGHDVIATLCGVHTEQMSGQITLVEARERSF